MSEANIDEDMTRFRRVDRARRVAVLLRPITDTIVTLERPMVLAYSGLGSQLLGEAVEPENMEKDLGGTPSF